MSLSYNWLLNKAGLLGISLISLGDITCNRLRGVSAVSNKWARVLSINVDQILIHYTVCLLAI